MPPVTTVRHSPAPLDPLAAPLARVEAARLAHATQVAEQVDAARHSRYMPPVYSPIPREAFWGAVREALVLRDDPRPAFAAQLCTSFGAERATLFSSGTHALAAAIAAARRVLGGPPVVALPAYTCFEVASAAVGADTRIAIYDLDPDTLTPSLESLASTMAAGARIIVIAPLFGIVPDWETIFELATAYHAIVIEDAAQGLGSSWHAVRAGAIGALSVLSFGRGKGWTGGGGGAVLQRRDAATFDVGSPGDGSTTPAKGIVRVAAQRALAEPDTYAFPASLPFLHLGETRYHRMSAIAPIASFSVRVLSRSWTAAHREAGMRRRNARAYRERLADVDGHALVRPHSPRILPRTGPGYLRFPVRVPGGWAGLENVGLARHAGVAPVYPSTLADLADVRDRLVPTGRVRWPGAECLVRELVTLPTHSFMAATDRELALRAIGISSSAG